MTPPPPSPTQVMAQPQMPARVEEPPPSEPTDPRGMTVEAIEAEIRCVRGLTASGAYAVATGPARLAPPALPPAAPAAPPAAAAAVVPNKLDLDSVEAFADLPDDARAAFAAAAEVSVLGEGEEVSSFALAYILSGTVDVAATMVDAPAARLAAGAVLRSRGTTEEGVPMRLIGVDSGVVATWTDAEVNEAFRTCPWVEEDLRTAADRLQTLVGVTIGPLGERLDASIREQIIGRLTHAHARRRRGRRRRPASRCRDLLLVGVGELELVDGDKVAGTVGSGEFLFPTEVLGGGNAPRTARAGAGGALILFGDRHDRAGAPRDVPAAARGLRGDVSVRDAVARAIRASCARRRTERRGPSSARPRRAPSAAPRCPPRLRSADRTIARRARWSGCRSASSSGT